MISVVIVTYNASHLMDACLRSLYAGEDHAELEVIVIDNASQDDTVALIEHSYPQARLIYNSDNRGFSAANNQGLAAASGDAILFLNSDTIVDGMAVSLLHKALQANPRVGACAPRLLNSDGTVQESIAPLHSLRQEFSSPCRRSLRAMSEDVLSAEDSRELPPDLYAGGAALMVRRDAMAEIAGFDEDFFFYYEDADLCARLEKSGWPIMYVPQARIAHLSRGSSAGLRLATSMESLRSKIIYFRKHAGLIGAGVVALLGFTRHARRAILNGARTLLPLRRWDDAGGKAAFHARICVWLLAGAPHRGRWLYDRLTGGWR